MQASLAATSLVSGIAAWLAGASLNWLIGALLIGAVIPFTLIVILPTNRRLLESTLDLTSDVPLQLLRRWGRLHSVRTVLSLAAFGLFAAAMISGQHCDAPVCSSRDSVLRARESVLRQDLFMLRSLILQYTLDKQKAPKSLEDLVKAGYLKQIPVDPITGKADWDVDVIMDLVRHKPGISSVRSSSQEVSSDRTVHSTW
jgi:anthrone oxygenase-like protein